MRKTGFLFALCLASQVNYAIDYDRSTYVLFDDNTCSKYAITEQTSFGNTNGENSFIIGNDTLAVNKINCIKFIKPLVIDYNNLSIDTKELPMGVSVAITGNDVAINMSPGFDIEGYEIIVTGSTSNGSLVINQTKKFSLLLDNLDLTTTENKPAILINGTKNVNVISNGKNYISSKNNSLENGSIYSNASLYFNITDTLTVGNELMHGIRSKEGIKISCDKNSALVITSGGDGIRANDFFETDKADISITADGDGIDANNSYIKMSNSKFVYSSAGNDVKGLKCAKDIDIMDSDVKLSLNGLDSKGFSTGKYAAFKGSTDSLFGNVNIHSGKIDIFMTGSMQAGDTTKCTAIKSDGNVNIYGGNIYIKSGDMLYSARGINADGIVYVNMNNGGIVIEEQGNACRGISGERVIIEQGNIEIYPLGHDLVSDSLTSSAIKADSSIIIGGGAGKVDITIENAGTKGKGLNCDLNVEIMDNVTFLCSVTGDGAKGISCGNDITGKVSINGTNTEVAISLAGDLWENPKDVNDDSKTAGIKCDGDVTVNANVKITHENEDESKHSARGIQSDGSVYLYGGMTDISLLTDKSTYSVKATKIMAASTKVYKFNTPNTGKNEPVVTIIK